MSRATPEMRDLAVRLIAFERRQTKSSAKTPAAFHVCEKLRPHLAALMGSTGFHALLTRALAVANAEDPWLREIHVKADGSMVGWDECKSPADAEKQAEASVVLLAQLLGLLEAFVGQNLTLRMLRDVWPKLTLSNLFFHNDDQK